jgi:anti-sigma factor RsiW
MNRPQPCDAYAERLIQLVWDELEPPEASEVEAHASACGGCGGELAHIRALRRMVERLPQAMPHEGGGSILAATEREARGGDPEEDEAEAEPRWSLRALPFWAVRAIGYSAALIVAAAAVMWILAIQ